MASGQWWNIWTLASPQAEEIVPHTIHSASTPQQGDKSPWGEIFTVNGPYPSKSAAEAALGKNHGPAPGSTGPQDTPGLAGIDEIGAVLKAFFQQLTRAAMWRCLGWIVLGFLMLGVGVYMWLTKEGIAPSVVPLPV